MAYLAGLELIDFRAFRHAALEFQDHGLVLVTGPNNAGKSALLSALDVVAGRLTIPAAGQSGIVHSRGRDVVVRARFDLNDDERAELLGPTSDTGDLMRRGAAAWLLWEFNMLADAMQAATVRIAWPSESPETGAGAKIIAEVRRASNGEWSHRHTGGHIATHSGELTASIGGSIARDVLELGHSMPYLKPASDVLQRWRKGYFHFSPLRQASGRTNVMHSAPELAVDGSNLHQVLLHIRNNERALWEKLVDTIQQIVPGVGELILPSHETQFEIAFQEPQDTASTHYRNIKDLGTGVEQLLMTLVVGMTATATTVVLEEPETGLHPAAQRALLSLLQEWGAKDRTIMASTHSPVLLDWSSASVFAVSRGGSESTIEQVTNQRAATLRDLGVRLSDVLAAERILVLEGPSDEQLMSIWFPELMRNPKVVVISAGGGDSARHAELVGGWLDHADQLGARKLLFVRDRDELPERLLSKLEKSGRVLVLPCRELENLLLNFDVIASKMNDLRNGKLALSATDVEATARAAADKLKPTIVLKRVCWDLDIHRHVDNRLRSKLADQRASKEDLIREVLNRLPSEAALTDLIKNSWKRHEADVEARWDTEWRQLVPGADVLEALWRRYLQRGYDKSEDGLRLANSIPAPAEIAKTIKAFEPS